MTGEQATLSTFDGGEDGDGPGDGVEALREDMDRLAGIVDTLAESQQDLADAVAVDLLDGRGDGAGDGPDGTLSGRGFQ